MFSYRNQESRSAKRNASQSGINVDLLGQALNWVLSDKMFADLPRHGNVSWSAKSLVATAIVTAWMDCSQLTESFAKANKLAERLFGTVAVWTYQGLTRALVRYGAQLLQIVWTRLHFLMESVGGEHYRLGKWLLLAVDGSRFTTSRTKSNEQAFAARNFGKGKDARARRKWKNKRRRTKRACVPVKPQIWMTLVWHMGLKLPWCWQTGPSDSSERHHFMDLLQTRRFPENTLFCGDAGFVGYELWSTIIAQGHSFLIRVGGNVRFLKHLGKIRRGDGLVYLWPKEVARRRQPPLTLRLIEAKGPRGSMFLVTNVLSDADLSTTTLKIIYPLRWGVELQFRATKQTFGRGTLRSRNADNAEAELHWSLVALTMIQLLAVKEQIKLDIPPDRTSVATALKVIRNAITHWNEPLDRQHRLPKQLGRAVKDPYQRKANKRARYHPDYKGKPSCTKPQVQTATPQQRKAYKAIMACA